MGITGYGCQKWIRWFKALSLIIINFVKDFFFWTWITFQVFIEFVSILLLFYVLFFGLEACRILFTLPPGIGPGPPALEGEVLTTGPLGKSHHYPY